MKGGEVDTQEIDFYFVDGKFNATAFATKIAYKMYDPIENTGINNGFLVMSDKTRDIYYYNGSGFYQEDGETKIKNIVQNILKHKASEHYKNEVLGWIKDNMDLQVDRNIFNQNIELINLENCVLNIKTKEILEHSEEYFFNYKLPVKYDPDADCKKIKQFIKEIVYEDDIPVLQEWFGYCLYREYFIHTACMLLGDGANGKSTLLQLLTTFLGENNISNKELQTLMYNRFSKAKLYGKLANIAPDISDTALKNTGLFKALTGGDRVDAEEKFKGGFEFWNYAKLIFSANKLPKTDDESYAFYRRWILISFPNTFEGEKCDAHILYKITTGEELSGLLNWALEGLQRLLQNGKFSYGKTVEEVSNQYKTLSDPIYAYCMEYLKCEKDKYIPKADLYQHYVQWAKTRRLPITANNMLTGELKKHLPELRNSESKINSQRTPVYRNITWQIAENDKKIEELHELNNFS